ncbi:hypothetical protein Pmani_011132 [Petrolisthes manimaculis]|uniref:Uncharacterized protein n=1 Tax=Petrolisthes manimaculis TaxID=1843537 RepID=A0AAE1UBC9_9EUCA|nr:hypothetical protein Pmani_011132 [Petrolisthes manimaculis]
MFVESFFKCVNGVVDAGGQLCKGNVKKAGGPSAITSPLAYISNAKYKIHTYKNSAGSIFDEAPTTPSICVTSGKLEASTDSLTTPHYKTSRQAGRWVRPLGYAERFMTLAHDYGCMTTVYSLWLESSKPLEFDFIKQTTVLMFRKMPNLRMHLDYRHGDLWWREMVHEVVDVEEITSDNVEETVQELLRRRYRMHEGPLWFTRFVNLTEDDQYERDSNFNLRYKYVCIFGFHHNVSDGSTNMKFCQVFLKVLNDLYQGNNVDLSQEGTFAMPIHDRLGEEAGSIWFYMGIFLRRFYTILLTFGHPVWNFTSYYRMPFEQEAGTHLLQRDLDKGTTQNLLKRCKMEGVTLNSTFTAAANLALYTMMLNKDKKLGLTHLCSQQAINMRRYWPKEHRDDTFGCHISLLDLSFPTQEEDLKAFWEYTRGVHNLLSYHLTETKRALKLQPMSVRLGIIIRHNAMLAKLGLPSSNDNHYTVTNMGNLSTTFPGSGPEVEVTKVLRTVSCHFMPTLCQHTLQTFRGCLSYSLDYYTQKLSPETASQYASIIMSILASSIHQPN